MTSTGILLLTFLEEVIIHEQMIVRIPSYTVAFSAAFGVVGLVVYVYVLLCLTLLPYAELCQPETELFYRPGLVYIILIKYCLFLFCVHIMLIDILVGLLSVSERRISFDLGLLVAYHKATTIG